MRMNSIPDSSSPVSNPTVSFASRSTSSEIGPTEVARYAAHFGYSVGLRPSSVPVLLTIFDRPLISRFHELFGAATVELDEAGTQPSVVAVRPVVSAGLTVMVRFGRSTLVTVRAGSMTTPVAIVRPSTISPTRK